MTVVAAIALDGRVVMAADTVSQYQGTLVQGAHKIRRLQAGDTEVLLSGSGNGAIVQLAERLLKIEATPGPQADEQNWDDWAAVVASAISEILAEIRPPVTTSTSESQTFIDGAYLLGTAGRLWYLFTHQALRVIDGIAALGSGSDLALGVLSSVEAVEESQVPGSATSDRPTPEALASAAVRVACRFDPHCAIGSGGPQVEMLA